MDLYTVRVGKYAAIFIKGRECHFGLPPFNVDKVTEVRVSCNG